MSDQVRRALERQAEQRPSITAKEEYARSIRKFEEGYERMGLKKVHRVAQSGVRYYEWERK